MKKSQKRTSGFGGKALAIFGSKNQDKRQCLSSAYLHLSFRRSSAYVSAYLAFTRMNMSFVKSVIRFTICLERIVHSGASCGFLEKPHNSICGVGVKNYEH